MIIHLQLLFVILTIDRILVLSAYRHYVSRMFRLIRMKPLVTTQSLVIMTCRRQQKFQCASLDWVLDCCVTAVIIVIHHVIQLSVPIKLGRMSSDDDDDDDVVVVHHGDGNGDLPACALTMEQRMQACRDLITNGKQPQLNRNWIHYLEQFETYEFFYQNLRSLLNRQCRSRCNRLAGVIVSSAVAIPWWSGSKPRK